MKFSVYTRFVSNLFFVIASCALLAAAPAYAAEVPATLNGTELVDATKSKSLMDGGVKLFDLRAASEFAEGHAKGAINVPYKEKSAKAVNFDASQDSFDVTKLPADKSTGFIVYCSGLECWKSYKGAIAAIKAGHKKIYWLRGGFPEWKAKGLPTE